MEKEKLESTKQEKISICDIMKEETSEIIKNMESKMPLVFQNHSDCILSTCTCLMMFLGLVISQKKNSLIN